jgi:hypothetical protein
MVALAKWLADPRFLSGIWLGLVIVLTAWTGWFDLRGPRRLR